MFAQMIVTLFTIGILFIVMYKLTNYFFPMSEEEKSLVSRKKELIKAKLLVKTVEEQEKIDNELLRVRQKLKERRKKR